MDKKEQTAFLNYKGFTGTINYSFKDNIYYGHLNLNNDLVSYEAFSVDCLNKEFVKAVDDYIKTCKSLGKVPNSEVPHG